MTTIKVSDDAATISFPVEILEKFGLEIGEQIELVRENDQIVIRKSAEIERRKKLEEAEAHVFEEWNDVFVALAKSADEKSSHSDNDERGDRFVLSK